MRHLKFCIILLAIFACTAFVFMTIRNRAEIRQLEKKLVEAEKQAQHVTKQPTADNKPLIEQSEAPNKVAVPKTARQPVTTYKNNGEYIEIDYSFLDNPEEAIRRHAEIVLNREKYSRHEYDKALQESSILSRKIREGYYGEDEYRDELEKLADKVFWDPLLAKQGLSIEKLDAMVRGEIPPMVVPIDPKVVEEDANKGGSK